jgi:hypothetical protein
VSARHTGQHVASCVACHKVRMRETAARKQEVDPTKPDPYHTGQHLAGCEACIAFRRQAVIFHRALHAPEGLTQYEFTKGMTKMDALKFWSDARLLGLISVGQSKRGAKLFALPSYKAPSISGRVKP